VKERKKEKKERKKENIYLKTPTTCKSLLHFLLISRILSIVVGTAEKQIGGIGISS
jgi:hypothetical protein